jgi:hypothetical protein
VLLIVLTLPTKVARTIREVRQAHPAGHQLPAAADAGVARGLSGRGEDEGGARGLHRHGPGESKHADIGISLPGTGEAPSAPVFIDGEKAMTLRGDGIAGEFQQIFENYVRTRHGSAPA